MSQIHSSISPLLVRLALAGAVTLAVSSATGNVANAQPAFAVPNVEMLPTGTIVADGVTPVSLQLLALNSSGSPIQSVEMRLSMSDGQTVRLAETAPGLYTGNWTPKQNSAGTIQATLNASGPAKNLKKAWSLSVQSTANTPVSVTANPAQVTLGQDVSSTLTFSLSGAAAATATAGDLTVLSSAGDVSNLTAMGNGTFTALFRPPAQAFPQVAVVTLVDRRSPDRSFGSFVLQMVGKAAFPVTTAPNSSVVVRVGNREFGPVPADASGRAQVPIVVPPGVATASILSVVNGRQTESPLDLQVPPSKRIRMFAAPQSVPADPSLQLPVRVMVARPDGQPDTTARVTFTATGGTVTPATHIGGGIYQASFTPAPAAQATSATVGVSVADATTPQNDAVSINITPQRPDSLTLTPEPAVLTPGAMGFQVLARVNKNGAGVSGQQVDIQATGARLNGAVRDLGGGDYQASFSPRGDGDQIQVSGVVRLPATTNPVHDLVVLPDAQYLSAGGGASTGVTVVAVDAYGHPVSGVPLSLAVTGGGNLPPTATTDANGLARLSYSAGSGAGIATLRATAGSVSAGAVVVRTPSGAAAGAAIPPAGSAAHRALTTAWQALLPSAQVARAGGAAMATPATATPTGVVSKIGITAEPSSAVAGGTIVLNITARDAMGAGVSGQQLTVRSSAGSVGAVQDSGNGSYTASLQIPSGASGSVQLTASTANGGVAAFLEVPLGQGSVSAWGVAAAEPEATEEEPAKRERPPREPREPGESPWLRLSGGYLGGLYSYQQSPSTEQGPLYSREVTVGGGATSPAGTVGLQLNGRAFLPNLEYLGFSAGFRSSNWSIELAEGFEDPIPDWLNEFSGRVLGRLPTAFDGGQAHVGLRAGMDVDDFLYFTQEEGDSGSIDLLYQQLIVPSTVFGVEAGVDYGDFFALGSYEMGFTDFQSIYSNNLDVGLGYSVTDSMFLQADLGWYNRATPVYAGEDKSTVGDMRDSMTMFGLQAGFQLK